MRTWLNSIKKWQGAAFPECPFILGRKNPKPATRDLTAENRIRFDSLSLRNHSRFARAHRRRTQGGLKRESCSYHRSGSRAWAIGGGGVGRGGHEHCWSRFARRTAQEINGGRRQGIWRAHGSFSREHRR